MQIQKIEVFPMLVDNGDGSVVVRIFKSDEERREAGKELGWDGKEGKDSNYDPHAHGHDADPVSVELDTEHKSIKIPAFHFGK